VNVFFLLKQQIWMRGSESNVVRKPQTLRSENGFIAGKNGFMMSVNDQRHRLKADGKPRHMGCSPHMQIHKITVIIGENCDFVFCSQHETKAKWVVAALCDCQHAMAGGTIYSLNPSVRA